MKVLVVGATGALGRPAVQKLRALGAAVRALNRHPEQAADLAQLGAEVVAGDLTDPASLQRACTGVQRVLACAHSLLGRGRWRSEAVDGQGHRDLFAAARAAGVQRIVYVSALGAAPDHLIDFFRTKHATEQALKASGVPQTVILRPTAFMEHHAHNFNGAALLAKGKVQLIGPGTKKRNFIAATDVAEFAVRALTLDPPPFTELAIGGHGHYTNVEVTQLYARLAGVEPRISHLPVAVAKVMSVVMKPFHPGLARVMKLMSLPDGAFEERFEGAAALEQAYGVPLKTLEAFAAGMCTARIDSPIGSS